MEARRRRSSPPHGVDERQRLGAGHEGEVGVDEGPHARVPEELGQRELGQRRVIVSQYSLEANEMPLWLFVGQETSKTKKKKKKETQTSTTWSSCRATDWGQREDEEEEEERARTRQGTQRFWW